MIHSERTLGLMEACRTGVGIMTASRVDLECALMALVQERDAASAHLHEKLSKETVKVIENLRAMKEPVHGWADAIREMDDAMVAAAITIEMLRSVAVPAGQAFQLRPSPSPDANSVSPPGLSEMSCKVLAAARSHELTQNEFSLGVVTKAIVEIADASNPLAGVRDLARAINKLWPDLGKEIQMRWAMYRAAEAAQLDELLKGLRE
jgi:hypothetical protein